MKIYSNQAIAAACVTAMCLLPSCSNSDDNNRGLEYDDLQVNFVGSIAINEWTPGTDVGIFATCTRDETPGFPMATNSRYVAGGGEQSRLTVTGDPIISYKSDHNFKFYAYFPYRSDVTSATSLSVQTPEVQEYAQGVSAYTTYVAGTGATTVVPTINMDFTCVTGILELNLADDITDEDGHSCLRSITLNAPEDSRLDAPMAVSGNYDLTTGSFSPVSGTEKYSVTMDFGANGITLPEGNTPVYLSVNPFTIPEEGLVASITDMNGNTLTTPIFNGSDAGTRIAAGEIRSCHLGRVSDGIIPVSFPVEWPLGYANGAYLVSALTQPQWLTENIWTCPSQPQAYIKWHKESDPSPSYFQKLEFVNSGSNIGSVGIKGVWTDDYFEATLPVKRFAAGTAVTISFPMYTRQGPVFWDIEYLDGDNWKCNRSNVTAYDPQYSMDCTFSCVRGTARIRHTMIFENEIKSGELKIRIKCADGKVQASADKTCTVRDIPYTDSSGYGAPFYFHDATKEMTSIIITAE